MFRNKILLITGGTGSFGNAVLDRFLHTDIKEIRIFSRDEKKQEDLRIKLSNPKVKFYIGDIRNYDGVFTAMHGVDYVFHAAALKQVPSCEFYPMEAIRTNVLGAEHILNTALAAQVEKVIFYHSFIHFNFHFFRAGKHSKWRNPILCRRIEFSGNFKEQDVHRIILRAFRRKS